MDKAFDGPRLAELGVDGVEEVYNVRVGGGGGVPGGVSYLGLTRPPASRCPSESIRLEGLD